MSDPAFANNPWSAEFWSLTRQGDYIREYGLEVARTKAKQAGAKIGDLKPKPVAPRIERHWVIQKKISGGGGGGQGFSGTGPPS